MRFVQIFLSVIVLSSGSTICYAQDNDANTNATSYRVETFVSVAKGTEKPYWLNNSLFSVRNSNAPFWMVSNRYGKVPLTANNGYLNAGIFHQQKINKDFRWNAGLDLVAAAPRYDHKNIYVQQLYAELGFKSLLLSIGSKENYRSLWDRDLSSGDMVLSSNARPIPEINLSMPAFTLVPLTKGWMQIKGDFALGRSFDTKYLEYYTNNRQTYNKNVLWHHKSLYVQIKDTRNDFPLSGIIGVQHWAQWGGTSTNPKTGKQPQSLSDMLRVICGSEGGKDATMSDQINVLGNHYGSYDFKLTYTQADWKVSAYHQHYFEDKSGMIFVNNTDGLWGLQFDLPKINWFKKIVIEHLETRDQSGPFHFIEFDHSQHKGPGGGSDDYYNNGEYQTGASYFNRALGSPLILSPEYNGDGSLGFKNNRVSGWHFATEGDLCSSLSYRMLFTLMNTWGRASAPLLNNKRGAAGLLEIQYHHPKLKGWNFGSSIAADAGSLYTKNIGFSFTVSKRGILKSW